ncbi:hypothetical protein E4T52_08009 [Aureobasidium sp. EXF-3400]|nr:hypothetical protein E4T51_06920 [Aureobasidium sp. EXF-12344]KAI4777064.1 hypothetical protein E4T52_08009 [Aureobasidium sp. EXF-3400]
MDTLPLELQQRVCSCLTIQDLKSLRLASKVWAAAACRYLLPRIFLFNHPDSCQEVQEIANHPYLKHSVTTLVMDTSCIHPKLKFDQWARNLANSSSTPRSEELETVTSGSDARVDRISHREKVRSDTLKLREQWVSYCADQQNSLKGLMLSSIALAFSECPRLKNLIVECHLKSEYGVHSSAGMLEKRRQFYRRLPSSNTERSSSKYEWSWESMHFDIWDVLKPVHDSGRSLGSLVLLDADLACPLDWTPPNTPIFQTLKHLRQINSPKNFLRHIVASAPELESFGTFDHWNRRAYPSMPSLMSGPLLPNLRALSLNRMTKGEDLAQFLVRQSKTLQHLRIDQGYRSFFDWSRVVADVRGKLPNLRRVEFNNLAKGPLPFRWGMANYFSTVDILQGHKHKLESDPMELENGLWEDYEQMFFPDKIRT